ncbi:MAG: hypothetical protein E7460_06935 [Ruminococcaceae bacterium]|nr:hypothetical protein [Oscillospiraceae bacterium]
MFYFKPKNAVLAIPGLVILALAIFLSLRGDGAAPVSGYVVSRVDAVVLDAGHGGADGGTVGRSGTVEKDINLEITLLTREFCDFLGVKTVLTRDSDVSLGSGETLRRQKATDLRARVELVRSLGPVCLISIHQNYYGDRVSRGAQVFYAPGNQSGEALAKSMRQSIAHATGEEKPREAMAIPNGNYLLENLACPAIIIECGFLSHPEEEMLLNSPEYRARLAFAVAAEALNCVTVGIDPGAAQN